MRQNLELEKDGFAVKKRRFSAEQTVAILKQAELGIPVAELIRPARPNQVSSLDFVADQLIDVRRFRVLMIVDVFTRESLTVEVGRSLKGTHVVGVLNQIRARRGVPRMLFCDNCSEFSSQIMDLWAYQNGVKIDFSQPVKPTDNAYIETFNGTLRAEGLDTHGFGTREEAKATIEAAGGNIMRAVLTGLSGRGHRWNSPMTSRLAATSWGSKQPKTHLKVGTKKPGPVSYFYKTWAKVLKAAGIERHLVLHSLRNTRIRNLVRSGISEHVAMTISGHKTRSVFDRYDIASTKDLRDAARSLDDKQKSCSLATVKPVSKNGGDSLKGEVELSQQDGWWAQQDSNLRPTDYESAALTN
jgi:transposase InsO family protein